MKKTPHHFTKPETDLPVSSLARYVEGWLLDCEIRQLSRQTLAIRRFLVGKLLWFFGQKQLECCGVMELRQFLAYVTRGHSEPGGRWGNPHMTKPVRPSTVRTYCIHLHALFAWLVEEGILEASPMDAITAPTVRADQVQPFNLAQQQSLLSAARKTLHPRRDEAILLILLDTGMRASELCGLCIRDVDMAAKRCTVLGKGNKTRSVFFGRSTAKALWNYLREETREPALPLFQSDRGTRAGEALTRSGLLQLVERLGQAAKIEATRCSPHTFRHTFAISFLRNGGNVFSLQQLLGHASLHMTNKYVALAQADIENQHRQFSPVDRLKAGVL